MKTPDGQPLVPTFDWYQTTVLVGIKDVVGVLQPMARDEAFREEKPKLKGYAWACKIGGPGGSLLIHWGGRNGDEHGPNVCSTGPLSPITAELLRSAQVPHRVSRADVRLDFLGDYTACRLALIERCNQAGMSPRDAGSCPEALKQCGRSVYTGGNGSFLVSRLYQKGLQLGDGYPVDYLRLEHQFMPTKSHEKLELASLSPTYMIGLRPLSRDLSMTIAQLAVSPYKLTKYPKQLTPYHWMLQQYQKALREMHQDHGSWAAVGQQIGLDLEEIESVH
jgi:hypothetical protein